MSKRAGFLNITIDPKQMQMIVTKTGDLMQQGFADGVQQAADIVKDATANIHRVEKHGWSMQDNIITQMTESTQDSATAIVGPSKKRVLGIIY